MYNITKHTISTELSRRTIRVVKKYPVWQERQWTEQLRHASDHLVGRKMRKLTTVKFQLCRWPNFNGR